MSPENWRLFCRVLFRQGGGSELSAAPFPGWWGSGGAGWSFWFLSWGYEWMQFIVRKPTEVKKQCLIRDWKLLMHQIKKFIFSVHARSFCTLWNFFKKNIYIPASAVFCLVAVLKLHTAMTQFVGCGGHSMPQNVLWLPGHALECKAERHSGAWCCPEC